MGHKNSKNTNKNENLNKNKGIRNKKILDDFEIINHTDINGDNKIRNNSTFNNKINNNIIDNNIINNDINNNYLQTDININNYSTEDNDNNINKIADDLFIKDNNNNNNIINNNNNIINNDNNNIINNNNNNKSNNNNNNNITINQRRTLVHSKSTLVNKYFPNKKKKPNEKSFEQKVALFRTKLKPYKIPFIEGACFLKVNREDVINSSMKGLKTVNLKKELKIDFIGEICQDAGGLIREWLTVLFKEILDPKQELFERADNDEISYIFSLKPITKAKMEKYEFVGTVLAKALLENLTINCCFNTLIYKILLEEEVKYEDLVFIDKQLYKSLKEIKDISLNGDIGLYELYFNLDIEKDGKITTYNLIENGENIQVTNKNIDLYIEKRISFLVNSQIPGIESIKKGIKKVYPIECFSEFSGDQLSLLINGTPFIDLSDWTENTEYKDYKITDEIIINFWEILNDLSQDDLSKFLLFVTGSSRVPIGGFKSLESNRGNKNKFTIVKIEYNNKTVNYLRAHTCFNRLDLPNYPNKDLLYKGIRFALDNEILGFGIE